MRQSRRRIYAGLGLASALATACGGGGTPAVDAGPEGGFTCTTGGLTCHGNTAVTCDAMNRVTAQQSCQGATPTCVPGVGCRVCAAGTGRCDSGRGDTPQTCAADGMSWTDGPRCVAGGTTHCVLGQCVDPCGQAALEHSYLGCEYWAATFKNTCVAELGGEFPFAVAVANPQTVAVTATVEGGALTAPVTRTIAPGGLDTIELPWVPELAQMRMRPGTSVIRRGGAYHIRSTLPVTVYQFNPLTFQSGTDFSYSNDASLLLPTSVLGAQYTALGYPGFNIQIGMTPAWESGGYVAVIGTSAAPTRVSVTLAGTTFAGPEVTAGAAGDVQTYMLGAGDVLQLMGHGQGSDLSGTTVQSAAPVAVHTGHGCAFVPTTRLAGNHLEEQLFPDGAWGRRYAVTAFIDRPGVASVVRIMAQADGTQLTFDPPAVHPASVSLGARRFVEFEATDNFVVTANHPILVAQFMYGGGQDTGVGDPAMVYEVPVEQYRADYIFLTPATYERNFVNIVGPTSARPQVDGAPATASPRPIGASGLSVWALEVPAGVHRVGVPNAATSWGIKVYGVAAFTAYAYPGGLDLRTLPPD